MNLSPGQKVPRYYFPIHDFDIGPSSLLKQVFLTPTLPSNPALWSTCKTQLQLVVSRLNYCFIFKNSILFVSVLNLRSVSYFDSRSSKKHIQTTLTCSLVEFLQYKKLWSTIDQFWPNNTYIICTPSDWNLPVLFKLDCLILQTINIHFHVETEHKWATFIHWKSKPFFPLISCVT